MDEMHVLRELLPGRPPPSADVTRAARARLLDVAVPGRRARPGRITRRPGARRTRWLLAVPALAGVAAVAVATAQLAAGHPPAGTLPARLTARQVLLTAATGAAAVPDTGTYWRVTAFEGTLSATPPNARPYALETRDSLSTTWYPRSPAGKVVAYASTSLASVLPTPGAIAAWQADGSPALPHRAGRVAPYPDFAGGDIGNPFFGSEELTTAQYQALPSSTDGLRARIATAVQGLTPLVRPDDNAQAREIFSVCLALLDRDPVTSAVRAATLRVLATLPGISLVGRVTDSLGRTGYGITMKDPVVQGTGTASTGSVPSGVHSTPRFELIISPSGTLLDEASVLTVASTPAGQATPASWALPGPTSCPSGYYAYTKGEFCVLNGDTVTRSNGAYYVGGPHKGGLEIFLDYPVFAAPAGTIIEYRAYLEARWTSDSPSASGSAQAIPESTTMATTGS